MLCPGCREIYNFREQGFERIFGAFFGRECAAAVMTLHLAMGGDVNTEVYLPRIYGFRVLERPDLTDEEPVEL
jgi:hypothetical protein